MSMKNRKPHAYGFSPQAPLYALIIVALIIAFGLGAVYVAVRLVAAGARFFF